MVRPDPIPNSDVKRSVADGSASIGCARVGSRQLFYEKAALVVDQRGLFKCKRSLKIGLCDSRHLVKNVRKRV